MPTPAPGVTWRFGAHVRVTGVSSTASATFSNRKIHTEMLWVDLGAGVVGAAAAALSIWRYRLREPVDDLPDRAWSGGEARRCARVKAMQQQERRKDYGEIEQH